MVPGLMYKGHGILAGVYPETPLPEGVTSPPDRGRGNPIYGWALVERNKRDGIGDRL